MKNRGLVTREVKGKGPYLKKLTVSESSGISNPPIVDISLSPPLHRKMPSPKDLFGADLWANSPFNPNYHGPVPSWSSGVKSEDGGSLSPPEVEVYPPRQLAGDDSLRINSLIRQGMILPGECPHPDCIFKDVCPGHPEPTQSGKKKPT